MVHEHLYRPPPCSLWPEDLLQATGAAYRETRGAGLEPLACLDRAEAVYIAAGGVAMGARDVVVAIIASLSAERGDWLWGPAQEWLERYSPAHAEPAWAEA
ncbi:hypothetical protein [Muricoccus vinaceus]|uniref:Uncharacterized protein n=1 Tax=Muricoccus vinaceus TaxID=424704 RepID=A0ABV6J0U4_9PROT